MPTDYRDRQIGESYKDYAARMAGMARAAEQDRDAARARVTALEALRALLVDTLTLNAPGRVWDERVRAALDAVPRNAPPTETSTDRSPTT